MTHRFVQIADLMCPCHPLIISLETFIWTFSSWCLATFLMRTCSLSLAELLKVCWELWSQTHPEASPCYVDGWVKRKVFSREKRVSVLKWRLEQWRNCKRTGEKSLVRKNFLFTSKGSWKLCIFTKNQQPPFLTVFNPSWSCVPNWWKCASYSVGRGKSLIHSSWMRNWK